MELHKHAALLPSVLLLLLAARVPAARAQGVIPLRVAETLGQARRETLTSGIPLAQGALSDARKVSLLDAAGKPVPAYLDVAARWPDGSIKWLFLHTPAAVSANGELQWTLALGRAGTLPRQRVSVEEKPDAVTVTTGPLRFRVGTKGFRFLEQVWVDGSGQGRFGAAQALLRPGAGGSWMEFEHTAPHAPQEENWLWDAAGGPRERFTAAPDAAGYTVKVEEAGPARAVVVARGFYRNLAGRKIAPFWVRYTAYAGQARVGVEHFFAFDGDPKSDFLRALALRLPLKAGAPLSTAFGAAGTQTFVPPAGLAQISLHESVPDRFYTCVPYTVDRSVPYRIEGQGKDGAWKLLSQGKEASGWLRVRAGKAAVTLAMRDFWQLHPKELRVSPANGDVDLYLWPDRANKVLDLRRRYEGNDDIGHYDLSWYPEQGRGVGKTHEFVLDFSDAPALQTWAAVQEPLRAFCAPQHYADTGLWGPFAVRDPERFPRAEARMDAGVEWLLRLPRVFHWDGMIDWGDTLFNGYEAAGHGQVKDVPKGSWVVRGYDGWLNNDCSFAEGLLIYFLRTGDLRVWHRFERLVRHVNDVDTVHCAANPRFVGGGHRHDEQHWGSIVTGYGTAGAEAADDYFLTGKYSAREAATLTADWYLDGDWCEWENRILTLTRAWEATQDPRYLKALEPSALEPDYYIKTLHQPFFRSHSTLLGVALYAKVMPGDWARQLIRQTARKLIDEGMGNGDGRILLAIAAVHEKDPELRDWLRRFLASYDPYGTPVVDKFDYQKLMPGRAGDVSFETLAELVKYPNFCEQNAFGFVQGVLYQEPFVMRALGDGGFAEKDRYLADSVYKRKGWGWEWGLRGARVPALPDCHFESVSLAGVANRNPLADPFEAKDRAPSACALKPGEIGFQFQESGPPVPGYLPVRWGTLYPRPAALPLPQENDDRNLCGLPFGATFQANGIPFALPDPHRAPAGKTILVLEPRQQAAIPVGKLVRRLHFFGHVARKRTTVKEVGARYLLRYQDGTEKRVDLVNMVHFEHPLYWGFCKEARFARNWKLHGGWDGDPFLINTFTLEAEAKPLKEIVVEDTGKEYGFTLLAVTAEVSGAAAEKPVAGVRFGAADPGASRNAWKEGAAGGWRDLELPLEQGEGQVYSHGRATWRMPAPNGDYDLELQMSGWGGNLGVDVSVNGRLRLAAYCPTHQAAPGSDGFAETVRFPVSVRDGFLDVTIANDAGAGTWWHPAPIKNSRWALWSLALLPSREPAPDPQPEVAYGWMERDIEWLRHPWSIHEEATLDLAKTCLRSQSPRGTFRADVPAGKYEMELVLGFKGERQQGQSVRMNLTVQGQPVLKEFVSPPARQPQRVKVPVTVAAGKPLEMVFEPAGAGTEWGINALVLRPAR